MPSAAALVVNLAPVTPPHLAGRGGLRRDLVDERRRRCVGDPTALGLLRVRFGRRCLHRVLDDADIGGDAVHGALLFDLDGGLGCEMRRTGRAGRNGDKKHQQNHAQERRPGRANHVAIAHELPPF